MHRHMLLCRSGHNGVHCSTHTRIVIASHAPCISSFAWIGPGPGPGQQIICGAYISSHLASFALQAWRIWYHILCGILSDLPYCTNLLLGLHFHIYTVMPYQHQIDPESYVIYSQGLNHLLFVVKWCKGMDSLPARLRTFSKCYVHMIICSMLEQ